jgi:hypothetical protein
MFAPAPYASIRPTQAANDMPEAVTQGRPFAWPFPLAFHLSSPLTGPGPCTYTS